MLPFRLLLQKIFGRPFVLDGSQRLELIFVILSYRSLIWTSVLSGWLVFRYSWWDSNNIFLDCSPNSGYVGHNSFKHGNNRK